jgi:hypothetical protein
LASDPRTTGSYRVLVTGSRTWTDTEAITQALDRLHAQHAAALRVVHGANPRGADAIAQAWADAHGVPVETYPADWSTGRSAGPARNAAMVATGPELCLAFIADHSRGATDTADRAEHASIPTHRHTIDTRVGTRTQQTSHQHPARADQVIDIDDGSDLIAVLGSPLDGQWFTWTDWQTRLRAAAYMADRTGRRSPVLDYIPAGYQVPNPVLAHTRGWAAIHRPAHDATSADSSAADSGRRQDDDTDQQSAAMTADDSGFDVAARNEPDTDDDTLDLAG